MPGPADVYRQALPDGEIVAFALTPLDRAGVPVWSVLFFDGASERWSGLVPNGIGYGATDEAALTGAMGELSEVVHATRTFATMERRRASFGDFASGEAIHPYLLVPPAGAALDETTVLEWVPATRAATGETVWVPIDFVAVGAPDLSPGYRPLTTPITNGLGAGPTLDWALSHGLLELLQRDGNGLYFRALDQGVRLDLQAVQDPVTLELLARLDRLGIELLAKLANTELGIANVYVVGADVEDGASPAIMATACGEAASPDREVALRKALLEFSAARVRKHFSHGPLEELARVAPADYLDAFRRRHSLAAEESRALAAMMGWLELPPGGLRQLLSDSVLSVRKTVPFETLPRGSVDGTRALLERAGFDVLYLDFSPPETGVHVVKAVVPRLEVETMSYYRIGERGVAKLLARDGYATPDRTGRPLTGLGQPPAGALPVRLTGDAEERLGGPAWLDPAAVDAAVGPLYPLYREPDIHSAAIACRQRRAAGAS